MTESPLMWHGRKLPLREDIKMASRFRNRLMGLGTSPDPSTLSPLTPLATRLCDALESIAQDIPQVGMVSVALRKQMARNPIPDEDILTQLAWVQEMVHAIIIGPSLDGPE